MAAVLAPLQSLSLDNAGIMDPSPISPNASRHGRSKHGGSIAKANKRGRGYSIVDDREALISKALTWVLKRTVEENEAEEEESDKLVADSEGWADCEDVLERPNLKILAVTFPELQSLVSSPASKARFSLKLTPEADSSSADPSDYLIRLSPSTPASATPTTTAAQLTPLTLESPDLPELVVFECSYASYPIILASGGIKRAGGQAHLSFTPVTSTSSTPTSRADVSISLSLSEILSSAPKISWSRTEAGVIVTEGDASGSIPKSYWKKAVARRADIGTLYENGEVRKEVPIGLRGKGVKAKKGKGLGFVKKEMKRTSEDEETASE